MKQWIEVKTKNKVLILVVAAGVAIIGTSLLVSSKALTSTASIEAESGTVGGNATSDSDSSASGRAFVKFNADVGTPGWTLTYTNNFSTSGEWGNVNAFQSSKSVNDGLSPSDSSNNLLQKPTLSSNVQQVNDSDANDGKAMAVLTKVADYSTSSGIVSGWTNGRMGITDNPITPPYRVSIRMRLTASTLTKSAIMMWPTGGGWPWEIDFVETGGGSDINLVPANRKQVQHNYHMDTNGDGQAKEQKQFKTDVDATKYHTYDLYVTANKMWIAIDGTTTSAVVTDPAWIPDTQGYFSVGKALTGTRSQTGRSNDGVYIDWIKFYKPS